MLAGQVVSKKADQAADSGMQGKLVHIIPCIWKQSQDQPPDLLRVEHHELSRFQSSFACSAFSVEPGDCTEPLDPRINVLVRGHSSAGMIFMSGPAVHALCTGCSHTQNLMPALIRLPQRTQPHLTLMNGMLMELAITEKEVFHIAGCHPEHGACSPLQQQLQQGSCAGSRCFSIEPSAETAASSKNTKSLVGFDFETHHFVLQIFISSCKTHSQQPVSAFHFGQENAQKYRTKECCQV